jgi:hypothetical protein
MSWPRLFTPGPSVAGFAKQQQNPSRADPSDFSFGKSPCSMQSSFCTGRVVNYGVRQFRFGLQHAPSSLLPHEIVQSFQRLWRAPCNRDRVLRHAHRVAYSFRLEVDNSLDHDCPILLHPHGPCGLHRCCTLNVQDHGMALPLEHFCSRQYPHYAPARQVP